MCCLAPHSRPLSSRGGCATRSARATKLPGTTSTTALWLSLCRGAPLRRFIAKCRFAASGPVVAASTSSTRFSRRLRRLWRTALRHRFRSSDVVWSKRFGNFFLFLLLRKSNLHFYDKPPSLKVSITTIPVEDGKGKKIVCSDQSRSERRKKWHHLLSFAFALPPVPLEKENLNHAVVKFVKGAGVTR